MNGRAAGTGSTCCTPPRIPRYHPVAKRPYRITRFFENSAEILSGPVTRLPRRAPIEPTRSRGGDLSKQKATAAESAPRYGTDAIPLPEMRDSGGVAHARTAQAITTCSPATFTLAGVDVSQVNPPYSVTLTDITPGESKGLVGPDGIAGHRIQNGDGTPKVLKLRIDVKDGSGNTSNQPVLVQLDLGGPHHGTLILDPSGNRIECSSAAFLWHDRDVNGVLIPNDEFEYRLGTFANLVGFLPDPNNVGHVLPVWGTGEIL